jgi:hypothetical protein
VSVEEVSMRLKIKEDRLQSHLLALYLIRQQVAALPEVERAWRAQGIGGSNAISRHRFCWVDGVHQVLGPRSSVLALSACR